MIELFRKFDRNPPEPAFIEVGGTEIPVEFRRNAQAKKIILRLNPAKKAGHPDGVVVTLPYGVDEQEGLRFAEASEDWICARLLTLPEKINFADGMEIPFRGEPHTICHAPGARRGVWREDDQIRVSGARSHLPRRVEDWLRKEAKRRFSQLVNEKAPLRHLTPGRVTVRDTRSRWGSCASNGNLSFSWRLILAPDFVIDYVVAHEVAHLEEHNHSPDFWLVVDHLTPHTKPAKSWLKVHGEKLHRYG